MSGRSEIMEPANRDSDIGPVVGNPEWIARQGELEDAARVVRWLTHDFGNILTGIFGFSELSLSLLSPNSPAYEYTKEIQRSAQRAAEFTQSLHWFCRRDARRGQATCLTDAIAEEQQRLLRHCPAGVAVRMQVADHTPPVAVEGEALRVLLRQVLENARDAVAGSGTITLTARVTQLGDGECTALLGDPRLGEFVEIIIADNGCGFSAEGRQRLFSEPSFTTKPRRRGLGLAMVYGILRNHRGGFSIHDAPAGGTVVRLYVPIAARAATVATGGAKPDPSSRAAATPGSAIAFPHHTTS